MSQTDDSCWIPDASKDDGFAVSVMHLKLRKMGEGEVGGYRRVHGATCSLEGGPAYLKGVLTQMRTRGGQGLPKAKTNLSLTELCAGA